jgi:hypothetical protein
MVRLRREFSRTLVEPLILNFDIHLTFGPALAGLKFGFKNFTYDFVLRISNL